MSMKTTLSSRSCKQFLTFMLCSILTFSDVQISWAFSDPFSDGITGETIPDVFISDSITESEIHSEDAEADFSSDNNPDPVFETPDIDNLNEISDDDVQAEPAERSFTWPVPLTAAGGFTDSAFRKWISQNVDKNHDGLLSEKESSSCTKITIPSMSIDSLEGIEYFYNLKTLDCSGNDLLFLDLSSNTALKSLDCSHNQLIQLDLSYCKKLKELNLSFNSFADITSIVFPAPSSLEKLNISSVTAGDFDISRFSSLKELDCSSCGLMFLNLSSLTLLEKLICSDNFLDSLNLSRLSSLNYLDCSTNKISTLKLPGAKSLNTLYCQKNQLTELNLSGFTTLKKLNCSDNRLTDPVLGSCTLEELICNDNTIRTPEESYDLTCFASPGTITVEENGMIDSSYRLTAIDKIKPVKIRRKFISAGVEEYASQIIYIGYLSENEFRSSKLFRQMQNEFPLTDGHMLSREYLKTVTALSFYSDFPLYPSDLTYFTGLESLTCIGLSRTTGLDLSKNPKLTELVFIDSDIPSLDLTSNTSLESVQLRGNTLSSLKVSGLTALTVLDCRFNLLDAVDTTGCPSLKNYQLFPQSACTVTADSSGKIAFSQLGDFHKYMTDSERIHTDDKLLYTPGDDFFMLSAPSASMTKASFSITDYNTGMFLGTCQITANIESGSPVTPKKPILKTIKSSHKVTITWEKSKNASGYRILRKEKDKADASWKAIATVSSSCTSYTDNTGLIKKSYLYTVQSYTFRNGKKVYSKYNTSGLAGTARFKKPAVKKPAKDIVITLNWSEVPGADGYRIYRRKKGTSKWTKLTDLSAYELYYTDETAVPKTIYDYAVRPYRSTGSKISLGDSGSTGYVCQAVVPKVNLTSVTEQNGGITVRWKRQPYVTGYVIYLAESAGSKYHKTATVRNVSEENEFIEYYGPVSFISSNPFYKVRAYVRIGKKNYYGPYSKALSAHPYSGNPNASDFSEFHMGYQLSYRSSSTGFDRDYNEGGNFSMAAAYLTRETGPVYEWQSPYGDISSAENSSLTSALRVNEIIFIPERQNALDNQAIKQAVMNYGAVSASYISADEYYSQDQISFYLPADYNANTAPVGSAPVISTPHAIAIVGWDDNYPKENFPVKPAGNGAFLCRNSWGTGFADNGYFYISYYDGYLGIQEFSMAFGKVANNRTYNRIYQYDPLGATTAFGYNDELYCANVFPENGQKLTKKEKLGSVSFYTYDSNYKYEVYIVTSFKNQKSLKKLPAPSASGNCRYAGYHTVDFSRPVTLKAGTRFAVVVKLWSSTGARTYFEAPLYGTSSRASASNGESYISHHGDIWTDFNTYLPDTNVCIKAFTDGEISENVPAAGSGGEDPSGELYSADELRERGFVLNPSYEDGSSDIISSVTTGNAGAASSAVLPVSYDLRQYDRVSPVRDQGIHGLCWAFSTYASLESYLLS